jgi:hypothetical protein
VHPVAPGPAKIRQRSSRLGSLIWCLPWSDKFLLDLSLEPFEPCFGLNNAVPEVFDLGL